MSTPRCNVPVNWEEPASLSLAEVAFHLRVSRRQAHRLIASGRLYPADFTLGGTRGRRWLRNRFLEWMKEGGPNAPAELQNPGYEVRCPCEQYWQERNQPLVPIEQTPAELAVVEKMRDAMAAIKRKMVDL